MSEHDSIYIERHPGDLITAEDWNLLQRQIRGDILATSTEAANGVTHVASADDAGALDGMDLDELTAAVSKRVLDAVRTESGYRQVFRILESDEFDVIEHGLGAAPLVDVYELRHFEVVCREDDVTENMNVTFYLHHSSEKRVRVGEGEARRTINIQPEGFPQIGIPFADMLARYDVEYTDTTSLEDLEVEFWQAFFAAPNDEFDDLQYCHSPWFERCCKEQRDVASLKAKGDWDEIWFQMRPLKIIGGPGHNQDEDEGFELAGAPIPANVGVAHLDLNRVALWLQGKAFHTSLEDREPDEDGSEGEPSDLPPPEFRDELKVMVLLRA